MKRLITLLTAVAFAGQAWAEDFSIGDLKYTITGDNTVSVDAANTDIEGDLVIPSEIEYDGVKYTVTSLEHWAFTYCANLTSIFIPNSITSIGYAVFGECSKINEIKVATDNPEYTAENGVLFNKDKTTLVYYPANKAGAYIIPNMVTIIEDRAFLGCNGLTSVTIPKSVTKIGAYHFNDCGALIEINVESDNTTYSSENGVLFNKDKMKLIRYPEVKKGSYTIPNTVTTIEWGAFSDCHSLTSVTIPESVTSIGVGAFDDCDNLESINIPNGITEIGSWFEGCSKLTSINIPENVTGIDEYAFSGCSSLSEITIPKGVKRIGRYAFTDCKSLTSIDIPESVTSIGYGAFQGCSRLTSIKLPDGITNVGERLFFWCDSLTSVTIPEGVIDIGRLAFYGCGKLTTIKLPESLKSIGEQAFGWNHLTSITIPDGVNSIGKNAFEFVNYVVYSGIAEGRPWGAKKVIKTEPDETGFVYADSAKTKLLAYVGTKSNITIPNTVINICDSAFKNCRIIDTVIIPESVKSIENDVFYYCTNLKYISIPNSVTHIGSLAFLNCSSLESVNIPDSITIIKNDTFFGCSKLDSIDIPESVTEIGTAAFYNCSSLTSITIPNSVTNIGEGAFRGCTGLESVKLPDGIKNIYMSVFRGCSGLKTLTIPNSVKHIDQFAFGDCTGLQWVEIPNSVTKISTGAFSGCSGLTSVVIPESVYDISYDLFKNCDNATIYCQADTLPLSWLWIDWNSSNRPVKWNCKRIIVTVNDTTLGYVTYSVAGGIGTNGSLWFPYGTTVKLSVSNNKCHMKWEDNNTDNPRALTVTSDTSLTAFFEEHTVVTDSAIAATCTEAGKTEGIHCSVCNEVLVAQTEIPALGHEFVYYVYNNDATTAADGTETATCEHGCGATDTRVAEGTKLATAVSESAANAVNIYANGRNIVVENAADEISVYDVMGKLICRDAINRVRTEIPVNTTGVYIVKVGDNAKRVVIN